MNSFFKMTQKTLTMNNGLSLPIIGLGTGSAIQEQSLVDFVIPNAYEAGYRMIDSAVAYKNEKAIGETLEKFKIPRKEMFLITKIPNENVDATKAAELLNSSLENFKTDYLDLVLLHFPGFKNAQERMEVYQVLEKYVEQGKVKSIGVSNFLPKHLSSILEKCKIKPAVNQIELHPLFVDHETIDFCRSENIVIQAYAPFARFNEKLMTNSTLLEISKKYNKLPSHVIVRWCIQNDFVVIPKSSKKERIYENIDVDDFSLTDDDILALTNLNCNFRVIKRADPTGVDF